MLKKIVTTLLMFSLFLAVSAVEAKGLQRIVSLKPNVTEILFALGAGDQVVGVTKYCDYPERVKSLPKVADYVKPFTEKIIELSPDIIIGSEENSSRKSITMLKRMGYDVRLFPFSNVGEMLASIQKIAKLVGKEKEGQRLARQIKHGLEKIKDERSDKTGASVLVVWGYRPMVVSGQKTYMDELLTIVGARNVVGESNIRYPHWSIENVIAKNPDVIIDMSMGSESNAGNVWNKIPMISAVKTGRVYRLDASMFRLGPRLVRAVSELKKYIYEKI